MLFQLPITVAIVGISLLKHCHAFVPRAIPRTNYQQLSQSTETNFTVNMIQTKETSDSFDVRTTITKIAEDNQTDALLFLGAMEDTIQQSTNNGEKTHYNVFRKSLTKVTGDTISLPEIIRAISSKRSF